MKRENLIKRLQKEGYTIKYGTFDYWEQVPYVELKNDTKLFLTNYYFNNNNFSTGYDSKLITYELVKEAIANVIEDKENYLLSINENYKPFLTDNKKITKSWEI